MKWTALHRALVACLLLPVIAAGVIGDDGGRDTPAIGPAGGFSGTPGPALFFPNISFPTRTMDAEDWYEQGFALTGGERYAEAITAYEQALAADRTLLNAWYYLGDALFRLGRYQEALLAFRNATEVDPDFVDAYFYEARVCEQLGLPEEAEQALGRGLGAADRRKAKEPASGSPAGSPPFPLALPPGTAILGAGAATVLHVALRQKRR